MTDNRDLWSVSNGLVKRGGESWWCRAVACLGSLGMVMIEVAERLMEFVVPEIGRFKFTVALSCREWRSDLQVAYEEEIVGER